VVLDGVFRRADGFRDFTVLEALGNQSNDLLLAFARGSDSVELFCWHSSLGHKSVRDMFNWRVISEVVDSLAVALQ